MTREAEPQNANRIAPEPRGTLAEVAKQFLRLGFIAYGGPAAHVAMMEEEFVRRRAWVTREKLLDLVGAVSLLPGPSSTELAIYLGEIRGGVAGLIVAGACFILPAAFLVAALAALSTVLVFRYKINSTWLVLGGAAAGIMLRLLSWS